MSLTEAASSAAGFGYASQAHANATEGRGNTVPAVDERTLALFEALSRALMWAAVAVIGLAVVAAIAIAGSESTLPRHDELQRQNRGVVAVIAFGSGLAAAGVLAGLGAIIRLMVADRREASGK